MVKKVHTSLNDEQRQEATRRVLAGEKASALSVEYGVTRAYISLLKAYVLHPERYEKLREKKLTRALTTEQLADFRTAIETSDPSILNLDPPTRAWCMDHGYQLAERMFGKRPSVRVMKECMAPVLRIKNDRLMRRPQPPEPHHISQLSPEFAKNEEFLEYYLSPQANKLAYREYELALADWISRYGDATEIHLDGDPNANSASHEDEDDLLPPPAKPLPPGTRRQSKGKHTPTRGTNFTPSKKKRRK
jgi:hypothetical protein